MGIVLNQRRFKAALEDVPLAAMMAPVINAISAIYLLQQAAHAAGNIFRQQMVMIVHQTITDYPRTYNGCSLVGEFQEYLFVVISGKNEFAVYSPVHNVMERTRIGQALPSHEFNLHRQSNIVKHRPLYPSELFSGKEIVKGILLN